MAIGSADVKSDIIGTISVVAVVLVVTSGDTAVDIFLHRSGTSKSTINTLQGYLHGVPGLFITRSCCHNFRKTKQQVSPPYNYLVTPADEF